MYHPSAINQTDQHTSTPAFTATISEIELPRDLEISWIEPLAKTHILQVWANDGGDKVNRSELRASNDPNKVINSSWNGEIISLAGARNEVIAFNLILEAPINNANEVHISLSELIGPDDNKITTTSSSRDAVFDFIGRNIELFYVRYLEIKGISTDLFFQGYYYDERHIPERCRRPFDVDTGEGYGLWEDRRCHNQFYPEIAVPLELETPFSITAGTNQSIWGDIYIPKSIPAGIYSGNIEISEEGNLTWQIPIQVKVYDFTLPDLPSAKTMLYYSIENINDRYLGESYPNPGTPLYDQSLALADLHFQIAHRHKISLIDGYIEIVADMEQSWSDRLNGNLFTPTYGYSGIGEGVGNNVYSIGTYGSWDWQDGNRDDMWSNTDDWVNWFESKSFTTPTDYFLYLIDESDDYPQIEEWAQWINSNPGPGVELMSMATIDLSTAEENTPSLDIPASGFSVGISEEWQPVSERYLTAPDKRFYLYNSNRPAMGSFAIEDEGVSLWVLAWTQYKHQIDRWFYWESTYYDNFQGNTGQTNVFATAQTFGSLEEVDESLGETGWNYVNGDGVLFYPGYDTRYPTDSYGIMGPFVSLRMKNWRRGIQDVDYLTLAAAIDPTRTEQIVDEMIPKVLWEVGVTDPQDPTWVRTDISWSIDSDEWATARSELALIIENFYKNMSIQSCLPIILSGN